MSKFTLARLEDLVVLPTQWADMRHEVRSHPECRLLIALLEDARHCLATTRGGSGESAVAMQRERRAAHAWIASTDVEPFTFIWVCEMLELNPAWVRRGLQLAAQGVKQAAHGGE